MIHVLFTMNGCGGCRRIKEELKDYIRTGSIRNINVHLIPRNSQWMKIFQKYSPQGKLPLLLVIDGSYHESYMGVREIMDYIRS